MASRSDIEAGKAYVELYVKNSALVKGLADVQRRVQNFAASVATAGQWMVAAGAMFTVPILAAAKAWAKAGDEMNDMAERIGISVEALSSLKFAANQSCVETEALENGLRKMQKAIYEASTGSKEATETLGRLGIRIADIKDLSPDEQFRVLGEAISRIENPTARAAMAMAVFGKTGTTLLPMLAGGRAEIERLEKKARDLGFVMSSEAAAAADELQLKMELVEMATGSLWKSIGAALAPSLSLMSDIMVQAIVTAKKWIKEHQGLVEIVFNVASAVGLAGTGLLLLAGVLKLLAPLASIASTGLVLLGKGIDLILAPGLAAIRLVGFGLGLVGKGLGLIGQAIGLAARGVALVVRTAWDLGAAVAKGLAAAGSLIYKVVNGIVDATIVLVTTPLQVLGGAVSSFAAMLGPIAAALAPLAGLLVLFGAFSAIAGVLANATRSLVEMARSASAAETVADVAEKGRAAIEHLGDAVDQLGRSFEGFGRFFAGWGDLGIRVFYDVAEAAKRMWNDVRAAFNGIQDAMAAGNWQLVGQILKDTLTIAWGEISNVLAKNWDVLMAQLGKATAGLWYAFSTGWAWVAKEAKAAFGAVFLELRKMWFTILDSMTRVMGDLMNRLLSNEDVLTRPITDKLAHILMPINEAMMDSALEMRKDLVPKKGETKSAAQRALESQIQSDNQGFESGADQRWRDAEKLAKDSEARLRELMGKPGTPQEEIAAARERLARNAAAAKALREQAEGGGKEGGPKPPGINLDEMAAAGEKIKVAGTYSAAALAGMGGPSSAVQRIADNTAAANERLRKIDENTAKIDKLEAMQFVA